MKNPGRWAYAPFVVIFAGSVMLIITQAMGTPASLTDRIIWLAITAVLAVANIFHVASARTWRRLYRSTSELYDRCEATRETWQQLYQEAAASADYWMEAARSNGTLAAGGEPDP